MTTLRRREAQHPAMQDFYDFVRIERKWQERWREAKLFRAEIDPSRPKYYGLEFFPYPSGAGLSVGHFKNYAPTDAFLRYKAMCGYNVLHPMGWDAFGQPAENEAIKRQRNPREMVEEYAANYRRQLELIGCSYDWDREINSSHPSYYRWTQWIFLQLYKAGLAYRATAPVNWCPVDNTVLANEEVVGGRCWRCDHLVEKRQMPQWFFRITAYAQRLLDDLEGLAWPEGIKAMQRNWIGRSEGAEVDFPVVGQDESLRVFTTRPDTLWGATFMVLAPEHPLVASITTDAQRDEVEAYVARSQRLSEIDRLAEGKDKTGVWTGGYAINPVNDERIPIWVADYVVMGYGTGAIMAVPAHDQRDFLFARKYGLPIVPVYQDPDNPVPGDQMTSATIHQGVAVRGPFVGDPDDEAIVAKVITWLEETGRGKGVVNYRLRDWLISRQRYWGAPIPIVHCPRCGEVAVPEDQLPVLLPEVENYQPTGTGESPLAAIPEFVNTTCPACGEPARRETDTMGGFACSSWYFLRFADPHNDREPFSREAVDYWLPVDMYVGGAEHAVMHLLYARFWTKALYDAGLLGFTEPFTQLRNQGMMLAYTPGRAVTADEVTDTGEEDEAPIEDWKVLRPEERETIPQDQWVWRWVKMSKSYGNVVTPDEAAEQYGADALRVYEMFVVPFEDTVQWSDEGIRGCVRFLGRVWRLVARHAEGFSPQGWRDAVGDCSGRDLELRRKTHQTIAKFSADMEDFRFNTAVAALMEWVNAMYEVSNALPEGQRSPALDEALEHLPLLLSPLAPHIADEMWEGLGQEGFLYRHPWPQADAALAAADMVTIVVQVNGKVRDRLQVPAHADMAVVQEQAQALPGVQKHIKGKQVVKVITVPGKLVNVVVR
ncbi:MAG: leucine--tRNA ligase [Armatimonadetes bacterium]|nr:leucine--tRNA ligase [Armatimonadota bacterium]